MKGRIESMPKNNRLSLPVIGKIKVGELAVSASGKTYPKSNEYFTASGKYANLFKEAYGEKPDTIQVVFPSDDAEQVCNQFYEFRDTAGKLVANGDGETFKVWSEKKQEYVTILTSDTPNVMELVSGRYPRGEWKITLTMRFILPLVRGVMGIWEFTTKGVASTIPNICDTFDGVLANNGFVKGVIFDLGVKIHTSNKPSQSNKYPVVSLVPNESRENLQKVQDAKKPIVLIEG